MELKTIGLTKKFSSKTAVDNLNITLTNGVYGLLGANGAGKTTLMRLLCNIQNPTSGRILLNEKNIVGLGERYRNLLGYLPQHFGYYPDFSAYDFLRYVSALKGLDEKAAHKKSKELLEAVDLCGWLAFHQPKHGAGFCRACSCGYHHACSNFLRRV